MKLLHCADLQMLTEIYRIARKHTDGLVLIAGDIYDRLDLLPRERDLFIQHLCRADHDGLTTVLISGNHDMIDDADGGYTHLRSLRVLAEQRRLRRTHVIETHQAVVRLEQFGINLIAVPSRYRKTTEVNSIVGACVAQHKLGPQHTTVALVHETVLDSQNDYGKRFGTDIGSAQHCVELDASLPIRYWALGDIHTPQQIHGCPHAHYSGAPIQHDFGDTGVRGVLVVDLERPTEPQLRKLRNIKQLVTVRVTPNTKSSDIPSDAYVRLLGPAEQLRPLQTAEQVVSCAPTAPPVSRIHDIAPENTLDGLPELLGELGLSEADMRWCVDEAQRCLV